MDVVGLGLTKVPPAEGIFASLLDGLRVFGLYLSAMAVAGLVWKASGRLVVP